MYIKIKDEKKRRNLKNKPRKVKIKPQKYITI
jgi:hypothetical protein